MPYWLENVLRPLLELSDSPEMRHAAMVHLPVALAAVGVPVVIASFIPKLPQRALRAAAALLYFSLAGLAQLAVQSGEAVRKNLSAELPEVIWQDVNLHESLAEKVWIFGVVTGLFMAVSCVPHRWTRWLAAGAGTVGALATLLWVVQVGHQGGRLVYEHGLGTPPVYVETYRHTGTRPSAESEHPPPHTAGQEGVPTAHEAAEPAVQTAATSTLTYFHDIKPVLQAYCYGCHSAGERKGGLDATTLQGLLDGGEKQGPAIIFGEPQASPLIRYVRGDLQPRMPKEEPPLKEETIGLLATWVAETSLEEVQAEMAELAASGEPGAERADPTVAKRPHRRDLQIVMRDMRRATRTVDLYENFKNIDLDALQGLVKRMKIDERYALSLIFEVDDEGADADYRGPLAAADEETAFRLLRKELRQAYLADLGPSYAPRRAHEEGSLLRRYRLEDAESVERFWKDYRMQWMDPRPRVPSSGAGGHAIDAFVSDRLQQHEIRHAFELCSDEIFLRRVYLDVIGVIPEMADVMRFLANPRPRTAVIDALLARKEAYASHWVPFWEDALGSTRFVRGEVHLGRPSFQTWIYRNFVQNRPYDDWVRELFDPYQGAIDLKYISSDNREAVLTTASDAGQVFLGTALKCASCHNHFSNPDWTQSRYMQFAGFFSNQDLEVVRCEHPTGQVVPAEFTWDLPNWDEYPTLPGYERPSAFAYLLTDPTNDRFTETIVNRLWKRFLGLGLYEPVDDYREDSFVSHPRLLAWLVDDFVRHDYDLKHLIKRILTSRTYQSRYDARLEDPPPRGPSESERYFRSPRLRRMTGEQFLDSVRAAVGRPWQREDRTFRATEVTDFMAVLGIPRSREDIQTERVHEEQTMFALAFLNNAKFHDLVYNAPRVDGLAKRWGDGRPLEKIVAMVYLSALTRYPTEAETARAVSFLRASPEPANHEERVNRLGDMYWAIFASPEFIYIH